jgi:tripartite-type tricarboxylate transporter receptor subunit TctC
MQVMGMRCWAIAAVMLASLGGASSVTAQGDYPSRTVRIIAGFVPASSTDIVARLMASHWSRMLAQQFVVENRPGAASAIAADLVARAPADGYTLLIGGTVNLSTGLINPQQSFDIVRDFTPVILIAGQPMILTVHPSLGVASVSELIALARSRPGTLSYGSTGVGASPHLLTELFQQRTSSRMVHVPYQGSPQAVTDLLAGRIQLMFSPAAAVLPHIQSGALKALASTTARRSAVAPDLPTLTEGGIDLDASLWFAIWAPAGTPRSVIDKLSRTGNEAVGSAEAQTLFKTQGFDAIGGTPEDFAAVQAKELTKWKDAVEAAGLRK